METMAEEILRAEKRGYSRGYQAKRSEGVDHKACLETQANLEVELMESQKEITSLKGEIAGMTAAMMLMKEQK